MSRASLAFLLMALLVLPLATGCRKGNAVLTPQSTFASTTTSPSMELNEVRKLIMQGCVDAGWTPVDLGNNTVEASILVRGKHTAVVDIPYTRQDYTIQYKRSTNLEYKANANGEQVIHPNYNNWVLRLKDAINKRLAALAIR